MTITRHDGVGKVPGHLEMIPTSIPELFKPKRTLSLVDCFLLYVLTVVFVFVCYLLMLFVVVFVMLMRYFYYFGFAAHVACFVCCVVTFKINCVLIRV